MPQRGVTGIPPVRQKVLYCVQWYTTLVVGYTLRVIYSFQPGGGGTLLLLCRSQLTLRAPTIAITAAAAFTTTVVLTFSRSSTFRNSIKSVSLHFVREFYTKPPLLPLLAPSCVPPPQLLAHHPPVFTRTLIRTTGTFYILLYCYMIHARAGVGLTSFYLANCCNKNTNA